MKFLVLTALIFVGCQGAVAQASECSTVPKASDRLACYDRVMPPTAAKPVMSKQVISKPVTSVKTRKPGFRSGISVPVADNQVLGVLRRRFPRLQRKSGLCYTAGANSPFEAYINVR